MSTVRADVVALMIDVEDMSAYPNLVRESTGKPMTPDEIALVGSAQWGEIRAVRDHLQRVTDWHTERAEALNRAVALLRKYGASEEHDGPLDPYIAAMTPADRAEVLGIWERFSDMDGAA